MQPNRLSTGGHIDRNRPLRFTFHGREYQGYAGDTLASALLANGVKIMGRSFKYHRPRGIIGSGVEEPGAMVEISGVGGNLPATAVSLTDGLDARAVNCWPHPSFDLGAITELFSRLIPAGFYYKTFMWPNWHLFEPAIRRAAGLARAPEQPPASGRYEARYGHADVLVVGAGPAGLSAALTAGRAGQRVILVDEADAPGGALLSRRLEIEGVPSRTWLEQTTNELRALPNVTHLQNATAWGYREHNLVMVTQNRTGAVGLLARSWRIRAGRVVQATGAIERALVFPGNDRPGVMLASAVQAYVNRYAVAPGRRIAVFTNNDSAYAVASDLLAAGVEIAAVIDSRKAICADARAQVRNCRVLTGSVVTGVRGRRGVTAVKVHDGCSVTWVKCGLLAHSGGWSPSVHLWSQSRGSLRYDPDLAAFLPDQPAQAFKVVGAAAGQFTLDQIIPEGCEPPYRVEALWHVDAPGSQDKAFVDILNDVTLDDVHLALREGYDSIEHVKRYTTAGMGLDQGKTGNMNVIGAVALAQGKALDDVGTTTFRAPYTPVAFGAIGGLREESVQFPYRHTPLNAWHLAAGAVMYEAGARWQRPGYYPQEGETMQAAIDRECLAVRNGVAVYDGSPLGTFEIKGKDAGRFLDLVCTNLVSTLAEGHVRYVMMLSDDGLIIDDGVVLRLGPHRWLLSTSTGHADAMRQHLEMLRQTEVVGWQLFLTTVTSQYANATVCGPMSRALLQTLCTDIDLSPDAFPFMSFRDGIVAGVSARIVRVSYTGALSYEINIRPRDLETLWRRIMTAGADWNITPVGSEANHVLRVEKGFLSLGHEVDGTVDPIDLGMGWLLSQKKRDFWGKRSVFLRRAGSAPRRELVGLLARDPKKRLPEGAPLTPDGAKCASEGFVTACVHSVVHNRWIALALLKQGRTRIGTTAHVRVQGEVIPVEVTPACFHDSDGLELRS